MLYDYLHLNSVEVDTDGNLLISARNTWTVYKVDRSTGAVLWRLGGKRSDFTIGPGHDRPALAVAIKLRLLAGGDAWDIVFPLLSILRLRTPQARRLFECE